MNRMVYYCDAAPPAQMTLGWKLGIYRVKYRQCPRHLPGNSDTTYIDKAVRFWLDCGY